MQTGSGHVVHMSVPIPPLLLSTPAGDALCDRMIFDDWAVWLESDFPDDLPCDEWLLDVQRRLGIKRGPHTDGLCAACGTATRHKCARCLSVPYCSCACQGAHWCAHRARCRPPAPKIEQHVAVALPEFVCSLRYQEWLGQQRIGGVLPLAVLNRDEFEHVFGVGAVHRTLLHLAFRGRPYGYLLSLCAPLESRVTDCG